jgi:AcrR family transcriptional regulator
VGGAQPRRRGGLAAGPRRLSPDARREQIVAGAVSYFAEVGFSGTTRDLARRLGVTQALLYRYFASKSELVDAVFEQIYLGRLAPHWPGALRDRAVPLEARLRRFYAEYTTAIFTYEWLRIFMWAGLAGDRLNRRYLDHVAKRLLAPIGEEIAACPGHRAPTMEDLWNLHGGIAYIGIRRFIYRLPTPADPTPAIDAAIARFLHGLRESA